MSSCDEINALAEKLCPELGLDFQLLPSASMDSEDNKEPLRLVIKSELRIFDEIAFSLNENIDEGLFKARLDAMYFRITEMLFKANPTFAHLLEKHLVDWLRLALKENSLDIVFDKEIRSAIEDF